MMNLRRILRRVRVAAVALAVVGTGSSAFAQERIQQVGFFGNLFGCKSCETVPACDGCATIVSPATPHAEATPAQPGEAPMAQPQPLAADASLVDLAGAFDVGAAAGFTAPNMLGDMNPFTVEIQGIGDNSARSLNAQQRVAQRYKVADNTSPIPRSRVFYNYNYFRNAFETDGDIHRNVLGAEIAFLDNRASVEIRQSLNSFADMGNGNNGTEAGNLVGVLKGVLYQDNQLLLSSGVSIGFPVGPTPDGLPGGNGIVAPFFGYLWQSADRNVFMQGFNQVDLPTDSQDQSLLHTDIAAGFWLTRDNYDSFITGIAPTVELHLYTPLGDAPTGSLAGLVYNDVLNMTTGVTMVIQENATLAIAAGMPLTERDDYDFEAQVQFNIFWGGGRRIGQ